MYQKGWRRNPPPEGKGRKMNLENYKPYARSEAEAQEIINKLKEANGRTIIFTYRQLPYAPSLWSININTKRVEA
jgi:hypothetical protein